MRCRWGPVILASALMLAGPAQAMLPGSDGAIIARDTADVPFDATRDATADVDAALVAARGSGKHVLLVMGGSWCHDSMALWYIFHDARFAAMLDARYETVWVDVGHRDRNVDIATRFGLDGLHGTPTVLILTPQGRAINLEDAPRWRNAASRKPDAIYRHFNRAVPAVETGAAAH